MAKCLTNGCSLCRRPGINNQISILLRAVLCTGCVIAVTACNAGENQAISGFSPAPDLQTAAPEKGQSVAPMDLKAQVEFSRKDLSQRLGIELAAVTISAESAVNWRSGALGCPEPGMNYTQALVPGVLIILTVGKEAHSYHAKLGGKPFYCPRERAEKPAFEQGADMT